MSPSNCEGINSDFKDSRNLEAPCSNEILPVELLLDFREVKALHVLRRTYEIKMTVSLNTKAPIFRDAVIENI